MSTDPSAVPKSSGGALRIILIVVVALVVIFVVIPCCVIAILAFMGPQIANIFSKVTSGLATP